MSLFRLLKRGWNEMPELLITGALALAMFPPAIYSAVKLHNRTWHYRIQYTVFRDDDPYAEELRESFKNFVPHTVPRK